MGMYISSDLLFTIGLGGLVLLFWEPLLILVMFIYYSLSTFFNWFKLKFGKVLTVLLKILSYTYVLVIFWALAAIALVFS